MNYTGQALTESFEGCKLVAYLDSKGVPTIGWGHTAGVHLGDTCTQEEADAWLIQDMASATNTVNEHVIALLTQDEFNALVDFVYNVGSGNFVSSTLLRDLNAGDYAGAASQFERWDQSGGIVVAGLLRRRIAEENEFNSVGRPG